MLRMTGMQRRRLARRSRHLALAVLLAAVVLVAACGDDDAAAPGGTSAAPPPAASDNERFLFDGLGRVLILHGTNADLWSKNDPAYLGGVDRTEIVQMATQLGFNVSRHLLFWEAIEPQPGVYNEDYLAAVGQRLDWYAEQGMHVILDMHQDCPPSTAFRPSADYTEYDGAPAWAARIDNVPYTSRGDQVADCLSRAVDHYLRAFFDPATAHPELQDHYRRALAVVVDRFHNHPAVLGYDVMNEPLLWIQATTDILLQVTAGHRADNVIVTDFMQSLIQTVRSKDSDHYIFVEPMAVVANTGLQGDLGILHDPRAGLPRLIYAPHLYESISNFSTDPAQQDAFLARWAQARDADAASQQLPQFLGEFGVPYGRYTDAILNMADQRMSGWAQWAFSGHWAVVDRSGAETALADHYVRPYPRAIAGIPSAYGWDPESGVLRLTYTGRAGVTAPTELFLPARHFPDGFRVYTDAAGNPRAWCWEPATSILKAPAPGPSVAARLCVVDASQTQPPAACPVVDVGHTGTDGATFRRCS